jgi:hypothetical protein
LRRIHGVATIAPKADGIQRISIHGFSQSKFSCSGYTDYAGQSEESRISNSEAELFLSFEIRTSECKFRKAAFFPLSLYFVAGTQPTPLVTADVMIVVPATNPGLAMSAKAKPRTGKIEIWAELVRGKRPEKCSL